MSGASQGPLAVDLWNASEFLTWAGLRLTEAAGGRARLVLEVAPHHRGGAGGPAVNGGIIAYLFDAVCAAAVASTWDEGVTSQATIQLSVSYQRLLLVERRATAEAEVVQRGGSTVFVDARVMDESDRTCAVAHGIYHLFRRRGGDADAGTRADTRASTPAVGQGGTPAAASAARAQAAKQAGTPAAWRGAGRAKQHAAEPGADDATRDGGPAQPKAERRASGRRSGGGRGPGATGGGGRARAASGPGGRSRG